MSRLLLSAALFLVACPAPPPVTTCVPGRQEVCACAFGTGFQTCDNSGRFGPCSCFGAGGGGGGATGGGGGSAVGGGGGSATGGGGGAVARVDELVSGTRLRATAWVGADGARAAGSGFWDTQLQTYCAPAGAVYAVSFGASTIPLMKLSTPRCVPLPLAVGVSGSFEGAGCSGAPLLMGFDYAAVGIYRLGSQPSVTRFGVLPDGGFVRVGELTAGSLISTRSQEDGGCSTTTLTPDAGLYGLITYRYFRPTGTATEAEFAAGTDVTE